MPTKRFYLPIYTIGSSVYYGGNHHTIEMVYIAGDDIMLKLNDIAELISSKQVSGIEETRFEI